MTALKLAVVLSRFRYRFTTEAELQAGIADALSAKGIAFEREKILTPSDRPDFLVGTIAIEVKIGGSVASLLRQCSRYLKLEAVTELLIVAGSTRLATQIPRELCGKPVEVLNVRAAV